MKHSNVVAIVTDETLPMSLSLQGVLESGYKTTIVSRNQQSLDNFGIQVSEPYSGEGRLLTLDNGDEYAITKDNKITEYYNLGDSDYQTPPSFEVVKERFKDAEFCIPLTEKETKELDWGALVISCLAGYIKLGTEPQKIIDKLTRKEYGRVPEELSYLYKLELERIESGLLTVEEVLRQLTVIRDIHQLQYNYSSGQPRDIKLVSDKYAVNVSNGGRVFDPILPRDRVTRLLADSRLKNCDSIKYHLTR